jgi:hypothetical protein
VFGSLKNALRRSRSAEDDEPKHSVSKDFGATGMQRLMPRWKKCVHSEVDLRKDNFNFVKNITLIYLDLIIVFIICSQKNDETLLS